MTLSSTSYAETTKPYSRLLYNADAEMALLGTILVHNDLYDRVSPVLREEYFSNYIHRRIYTAISKLIEEGKIASLTSLVMHFEHEDSLPEVGDRQYLSSLVGEAVAGLEIMDYANAIRDLALQCDPDIQ